MVHRDRMAMRSVSENETVSMDSAGDSIKRVNSEAAAIKKSRGRIKLDIEFIQNKSRRIRIFSKRKSGIINKVKELAKLTGTDMLVLVVSESGRIYTWATPKLGPVLTGEAGKSMIQKCLKYQWHNDACTDATAAATGTAGSETIDHHQAQRLTTEIIDLTLQESESLGNTRDDLTSLPGTTNTACNAQSNVPDSTTTTHYPSSYQDQHYAFNHGSTNNTPSYF